MEDYSADIIELRKIVSSNQDSYNSLIKVLSKFDLDEQEQDFTGMNHNEIVGKCKSTLKRKGENLTAMKQRRDQLRKSFFSKEPEKNTLQEKITQLENEIQMFEKNIKNFQKIKLILDKKTEELKNSTDNDKKKGATMWRAINADRAEFFDDKVREEFMNKIYNIHRNLPKTIKYINILLIGGAGAGKSSFVNSCATALLDDGRQVHASLAMKGGMASATEMLKLAPLRRKGGEVIPIRLFDSRGLFTKESEKVGEEEMKYIIDGHVKPNANITSVSKMMLQKETQRGEPKIGDEIHCVVYVIRADKSIDEKDPCLREIAGIRDTITKKNLPQCVLITTVDKILPDADDVGNMFRYAIVQKLCKFVSDSLKVSPGNIFPAANYVIEGVPDAVKDGIALCTLWKIVSLGIDYLNQMEGIGDNIPDDFFD